GWQDRAYEWSAKRQAHPSVYFADMIVESAWFRLGILAVVFANIVVISQQTEELARTSSLRSKDVLPPIKFWLDAYNRFDFCILALAVAQWGFEIAYPNVTELSGLKVLRASPFLHSLQVVVNALLNTLRRNVLDIILLLALIMFIFASHEDWGTFGSSIYTLFIYFCADGWIEYQQRLDHDGFAGSEIFTAAFIFIGNYIIANLFVGVICQNIDEATQIDRLNQLKRQRDAKLLKRELFFRKQRQDISSLISQSTSKNRSFHDLIRDMVGQLRHEDVVPMTHIACNMTWLETFAVTLTHQENTMYRCQQIHFGIANVLAEYFDRRLKSRMAQEN
ncbi:hypothetical protein DFJ73DRAFT_849377, partial [Zopfochytrium polystomum]